MKIFITVMFWLYFLDIIYKIICLSKNDMPIRTPQTMGIDLVVGVMLFAWAAVLLFG